MMRHLASICLAVLASVLSAAAETFVADSKQSFVMEAEGGKYTSKKYPIGPSGPSALQATLTFHTVDRDRKWAPVANFILRNGEQLVRFSVVLRDTGTRERLLGELSRWNGTEKEFKEYEYVARLGAQVRVQLTWTPSGTLAARWIANTTPQTKTIDLGLPPELLEVIVSGARVEFHSLEIGNLQRE